MLFRSRGGVAGPCFALPTSVRSLPAVSAIGRTGRGEAEPPIRHRTDSPCPPLDGLAVARRTSGLRLPPSAFPPDRAGAVTATLWTDGPRWWICTAAVPRSPAVAGCPTNASAAATPNQQTSLRAMTAALNVIRIFTAARACASPHVRQRTNPPWRVTSSLAPNFLILTWSLALRRSRQLP